MSGLKMMWFRLNGQLVCRWVDASESAETVLRQLNDDPAAFGSAAETNQRSLPASKAA
jgi:hypothetical protein